ncbi:DNA-binding SARP family transcriptional activator/Tfp pilus assembly protein PilF [Allocatelliglobosispora scoriae]|uniref:DNA-binding SARP family transcriptional activator/Tfp pilus assembly protein PilF n=1 Tax=Allocatelliglobosispora scoriae TaxID=643052 RepID=A0A841BRF1_9ACTN|nr:BTAD domain-containing putative transcriptional regulator [Allocatelliglobosispora scoriae]MBB5870814.1 DNA-binding SARP family transcriptional activator/Tfp pilus assembly protein PilF [Allocatelliglobosispora scoriae]
MKSTAHDLTFRVLGSFHVVHEGQPVPVGGPQLRTVLARLLTPPGRTVSVAALVREVWDADAPPDAERTIRTYVSRLRTALAPLITAGTVTLATAPPGYLLRVDHDALDSTRFERLATAGHDALAAARPDEAAALLDEALGLWRGDAYAEFADCAALAAAGARLERLRLTASEDRIAADQARGGDVVAELETLVRQHPERERLWGQLMLALYRADRQAEALAVFREARTALIDTHGIEPSPQLIEVHRRILAQDPLLSAAPADRPAPPPPAAAWPLPAQLPPPVTGFAGRDHELSRLDEHLLTGDGPVPALIISGPAGVGKTTLAVTWAHRATASFPDGSLYANLRGFDPDDTAVLDAPAVVRGFLDALGVPATRVPPSPDAQLGLFRSLLHERRMLILLDNARDVSQVRALLPGAPGSLVLVTSRNRLAGLVATEGAHPVDLRPMTEDKARELLHRRLGARRMTGEPTAIEVIIARCGGLPLALSIAAALAATRPDQPIAALAAQLADPGGVLDTLRGDSDPATDLRAVFSWSYRALTEPAAELFALLGLHPGPDLATAAAASLAGLPVRQAHALLAELVAANLVTPAGQDRYFLHDLLRAYSEDLLAEATDPAPRTAALDRLLDHYVHTSYAATLALHPPFSTLDLPPAAPGTALPEIPDAAAAHAWFDAERVGLLSAVAHAARHDHPAHAWQLAWSMARDLDRRGQWSDRLATQEIALAAGERSGDPVGQAHSHRELGMAYFRLGGDRQATDHLHQALDLFDAVGEPAGAGHARINLSMLTERQGDLHAALQHAQQAREEFQRAGNAAGQAYTLNMIGWKLTLLGDHEQAIDYCERALDLIREVGDHQGEADTWDSLGHAHHKLGDQSRAIACYRQAIALFEQVGDQYGRACSDVNLGEAHWTAADHEAARTAWRRALVTLDELGHPDADGVRASLRRPTPTDSGNTRVLTNT